MSADGADWRAELRREYAQTLPDKYAHVERRLAELLAAPADAARLETLLLAVHRLHGSAGSYGFEELGRLAGEWEAQLLALRDAGGPPAPGALESMGARLEALRCADSPEPTPCPAPVRAPENAASPSV